MDTQFSLQGRNIIITGASSGIGRSIAIYCSKAGANLLILGRNEKTLKETTEMMTPVHHSIGIIDLNNFNSYADIIAPFVENYGKISGLVHSAGIEFSGPYT